MSINILVVLVGLFCLAAVFLVLIFTQKQKVSTGVSFSEIALTKKEPFKNNRLNDFLEAYVFLMEFFKLNKNYMKAQKLSTNYHATFAYLNALENTPIYDDKLEKVLVAVGAYNYHKENPVHTTNMTNTMYRAVCEIINEAKLVDN